MPGGDASGPRVGGEAPRPAALPLFAELMSTSVVVLALCLPVLTAPAALAAGVTHLRRHLEGRSDTVREMLADFRRQLRGSWLAAAGALLLAFVLVLNLDIARFTALPGAEMIRVVSIAGLVAVVLVLLRTVELRGLDPHGTWRSAVTDGARLAAGDPVGSVLLLTAVGLCVTIVWMYALLVILVPGLLTFAVVGVASRRGRPEL
ncbi:hypothetical protein [Ruania halotolerans]|uniref:hypothetical protein n=1 Tax=Ruania halotolerans TaxID=2897773 RepID=UPI001E31AD7B|nr:hypothetical protein [Ruania halotolerans]UFU05879.1 hypothetical protein LQF10_15815 [Ruania halotolerans]